MGFNCDITSEQNLQDQSICNKMYQSTSTVFCPAMEFSLPWLWYILSVYTMYSPREFFRSWRPFTLNHGSSHCGMCCIYRQGFITSQEEASILMNSWDSITKKKCLGRQAIQLARNHPNTNAKSPRTGLSSKGSAVPSTGVRSNAGRNSVMMSIMTPWGWAISLEPEATGQFAT